MDANVRSSLDHLAVADPEAAKRMQRHLNDWQPADGHVPLDKVVDEVIQALAMEITFGRNFADGMGRMLALGIPSHLDRYRNILKVAADHGPTLANLFASHLIPVLTCGDPKLAGRFDSITRVMLKKGTYTLKAPLETLSVLIRDKEMISALAFLDLLMATYGLDTSYNRTVYLTHTLPRAVIGFSPSRRPWQIRGLTRMIQTDERLADQYLTGLAAGLDLLSETALNDFLDHAIRRHEKDARLGARFLSLESEGAKKMCRDRQVTVPLSLVRSALERYLFARTGSAVAVRPFSALPTIPVEEKMPMPMVLCDGRTIYLPDDMDVMDRQADNAELYKLLVRLEAGVIEFGTFSFDVEKVSDEVGLPQPLDEAGSPVPRSDLARFLRLFEDSNEALDLFTTFEHARIAHEVKRNYPGLHGRLTSILSHGTRLDRIGGSPGGTWYFLYRHLVLGESLKPATRRTASIRPMVDRFRRLIEAGDATVQTSAYMVLKHAKHPEEPVVGRSLGDYRPLVLPFGRRFIPSCFGPVPTAYDQMAADIRDRLAKQQIRVYRSDLCNLLVSQQGQISTTDLKRLIVCTPKNGADKDTAMPSRLDLHAVLCSHGIRQLEKDVDESRAFRYREWDTCMADYLMDRVRLREREITGTSPDIYRQTVTEHSGLVRRIRYAFELLRPEGLTILRQWKEGDDFDYRALLDYAMDKKAGLMPSDRLYIKRTKRQRDVVALLLVDLSRSTGNAVDQSGTRVLDVEKQAIVLLCEALTVVGDRFAIAGFSGSGPLGVDYYRVKDLDEPLDEKVKGRIGAMAPQRSTRMGAAIRHATAVLSNIQARAKLIICLGDGYPNDLAYKGAYAVEDTRRAIMEARTATIHVKAITVNVSDNGQLDRLYGATHHTLIGNVRDLPDRLVRVYSALTRH